MELDECAFIHLLQQSPYPATPKTEVHPQHYNEITIPLAPK